MKKITIPAIAALLITAIAVYAQSSRNTNETDMQVAEWENHAEQGDTAAMHRLIRFYDENAVTFVEIEAIIDSDGNDVPQEEVDKLNEENRLSAEKSREYTRRLNYWLERGIAVNDPVALATKGMRLYYTDEASAISYLSKAAEAGDAQAALFCGSACMNLHRGDDAFKYLSLAYELGSPSAGWHLAMCYSAGIGTAPDREKAIEVLRHAALQNCPEAVSEMLRIEPDNRTWQHKADSLDIQVPAPHIIE